MITSTDLTPTEFDRLCVLLGDQLSELTFNAKGNRLDRRRLNFILVLPIPLALLLLAPFWFMAMDLSPAAKGTVLASNAILFLYTVYQLVRAKLMLQHMTKTSAIALTDQHIVEFEVRLRGAGVESDVVAQVIATLRAQLHKTGIDPTHLEAAATFVITNERALHQRGHLAA